MRHGLPWYKREPRPFIDGCRAAKLTDREWAVYSLIIDLIYEGDGETPNDPGYISGHFQNVGKAACRRTIEALVEKGKLLIEGEMITQKKAKNDTKTRRKLSENRAKSGQIGGKKSAEIRSRNKENNDLGEASASTENKADKIREEKKGTNVPSSRPKPERFDEFWDAYPHRAGAKKGKADSVKKYAAAVKAGVSEQILISAARAYGNDAQVLRGFAQNPTTWLNQKGWENDIEIDRTPPRDHRGGSPHDAFLEGFSRAANRDEGGGQPDRGDDSDYIQASYEEVDRWPGDDDAPSLFRRIGSS